MGSICFLFLGCTACTVQMLPIATRHTLQGMVALHVRGCECGAKTAELMVNQFGGQTCVRQECTLAPPGKLNTIKRAMHSGDVALCQIILTTYSIWYWHRRAGTNAANALFIMSAMVQMRKRMRPGLWSRGSVFCDSFCAPE